jgi:hypothetical protein
MNVHVSYKLHKTPDIEKEIGHQIEKIQKRLQVFRPELVHLKAVIDQNSAREGTLVSLNLRLPSGQLAVQEKAPARPRPSRLPLTISSSRSAGIRNCSAQVINGGDGAEGNRSLANPACHLSKLWQRFCRPPFPQMTSAPT